LEILSGESEELEGIAEVVDKAASVYVEQFCHSALAMDVNCIFWSTSMSSISFRKYISVINYVNYLYRPF